MTDREISQNIQAQLGGTLAMFGAHTLTYDETSLGFKIKGSRKCNHIRIRLDRGTDTYSVKFTKMSRGPYYKITRDDSFDLVHVGELLELLEAQTGLYARL